MSVALQHERNFMGLEATGIQTQRQKDTGPGSQGDGYLGSFLSDASFRLEEAKSETD